MSTIKIRRGETLENYITRASKKLYSDGYSITEIANKIACDKIYVYNSIVPPDKKLVDHEDRKQMIDLYNKGMPISKISDKVKRCASCVKARIEAPVKCRIGHFEYVLSDEDITFLKRSYLKGKTMTWIGEQLNISCDAVKRRVIKCGIYESRKSYKVPLTKKEEKDIKTLYNKGYSANQIVKEIGRPYSIILKEINEFNKKKKNK